jgi:hypothetical protein
MTNKSWILGDILRGFARVLPLIGLAIVISTVFHVSFNLVFLILSLPSLILLRRKQAIFSQSWQFMEVGQYDQALKIWLRSLAKDTLLFKLKLLSKELSIYNTSCVYSRMGEFETSLSHLEKLNPNRLPKGLESGYYSLFAYNTIHLGGDLDLAEDYLNKAESFRTSPYLYLHYCYLHLLKNDLATAESYMEKYYNHPSLKLESYREGRVKLKLDQTFMSFAENFYFGLFYLKSGDLKKAKDCLFIPSMAPYDNFYKRKATELYNSIR